MAIESYAGKINRKLNKKIHVIDVAAGRTPADLVLKNATYVNVFSNELCHGDIAVAEGLIVGMGSYHGIDGFRTFSHYKSIVDKKTWIDLPMRYQKYRKVYEKMVRVFMR